MENWREEFLLGKDGIFCGKMKGVGPYGTVLRNKVLIAQIKNCLHVTTKCNLKRCFQKMASRESFLTLNRSVNASLTSIFAETQHLAPSVSTDVIICMQQWGRSCARVPNLCTHNTFIIKSYFKIFEMTAQHTTVIRSPVNYHCPCLSVEN